MPVYKKPKVLTVDLAGIESEITSLNNQIDALDNEIDTLGTTLKFNQYTANYTLNTLVSGTSQDASIALTNVFVLLKVFTTIPGRLRLYLSNSQRQADRNRLATVDPVGNHGLLLEVIFTSSLLSLDLSPTVFASVTSGIFAIFTPSESANSSTLSFTYLSQ